MRVRQTFVAMRYLVSSLAVSIALALVCFAQQASPGQNAGQALKEYPNGRIDALVREWTRARDYTREYLDAMPEDGMNFKPTPEIRSFAEQMLHLASALFIFASTAAGTTNPYSGKNLEKMEEFKTKAALTKVVMESYDFVMTSAKA